MLATPLAGADLVLAEQGELVVAGGPTFEP